MKKTTLLGFALCLVAGGTLHAQTGTLTVKGGNKFSYATNSMMNMTQSMGGQEMSVDSKVESDIDLTVKKVGKEAIDWDYHIKKIHAVTKGEMVPGGGVDTVIKGKPAKFTTDMAGRPTTVPEANDFQQMLTGGLQRTSVADLFSPTLQRAIKPGESWEENMVDTIANPALEGVKVYIKRTVKHVFDGVVDTLKSKANRIRTEVTSMAIEGSGNMQGMDMTIDGDGTSTTTSYYSVDSGLLLASSQESEMSTRLALTGQMNMVIPITYKFSITTARKGK